MECGEVRALGEAFVSEQLLVETTRGVVAHLDRCPTCRAEIDGLHRLRAATRSAFVRTPELAVRPEFVAAIASRLRVEAAPQPEARRHRRTWLAIAASVLLVVGAGWGWREWSTSSLSALLHAVVGDHRFCALTFKLEERSIPLDEAARRYGEVYGLLEAVEPSTTTLRGGPLRIVERHSCVFEGRRFAHIVLRYKGETMSLLVTDDPRSSRTPPAGSAAAAATPSTLPGSDGFQIASFRGARHLVFVVSSLASEDVQDVARAMVGPVSRALAGA